MDNDITNGTSDSTTSGSAFLSRKGLFGKSGVLNQSLGSSLVMPQDSICMVPEKAKEDHSEEAMQADKLDEMEFQEIAAGDVFSSCPDTIVEDDSVAMPEMSKSHDSMQVDSDHNHVASPAPVSVNNHEDTGGASDEHSCDKMMPEEEDNDIGENENDSVDASCKSDHEEEKGEASFDPSPQESTESLADELVCVKKIISMDTVLTEDTPSDAAGVSSEKDEETHVAPDSTSDTNLKEVAESNANERGDVEMDEMEMNEQLQEYQTEDSMSQSSDEVETAQEVDGQRDEVDRETTQEVAASPKESKDEDEEVEPKIPISKEPEVTGENEEVEPKSPIREAASPEEPEVAAADEEVESELKRRKSSSPQDQDVPAEVEVESQTPRRRRSVGNATVASPERRLSTRKKATPESKQENIVRTRRSSSDVKLKEEDNQQKTPRTRSSRLSTGHVNKTPQTPSPSKRKKDAKKEASDVEEHGAKAVSVDAENKRSRASKVHEKVEVTPTRRGDRSKNQAQGSNKVENEEKKVVKNDSQTPRLRSARANTSPVKLSRDIKSPKHKKGESKAGAHDPYDIETEMEKHPEPLKNIQMEVQSFGEVKFAKVGSGKYERTEKAAELRVGNLPELVPRTKQRKSLADLTPGRRKSLSRISDISASPQPSRSLRKATRKSDETDAKRNDDTPMEVTGDEDKCTPKQKAGKPHPKSSSSSGKKRRAAVEISATPAKRPCFDVPQLTPDELLTVDHPRDEHAPYEAGARVYAMFDGLFYPAVIISRDGLGRSKVHFIEDGLVKDVPPAGIIPLRALDNNKECYYEETADKDRIAVRVVKAPDGTSATAWFEAEFELERLEEDGRPTGKTFAGTWTKLALSKDDWKDYINKKSREATDVNTENIESTEERHLRRSRNATPTVTSATKGTKQSPGTLRNTGKASPESKTPKRGGREKKSVAGVKNTSESVSKETDENLTDAQGDQIFSGMLFILTSANRPNADTGFKKKFMTDFISSHGGLVVDDMKEVDEHPEMERFLVSDTHYRTHKYLAALVRAMPCVSHEWIYKCLNEKKLVDYKPFLLPSGVSILDEREYPLPTKRGLLLRNKKVMVHSNVIPPSKKSMSFEQIWVPMVPQLGGEVVTDMPTEEGQLDILLTDHSATASVVERARELGCVVVSSEWLIQGIIMDRLPDVNAHHKFLHNGGICT